MKQLYFKIPSDIQQALYSATARAAEQQTSVAAEQQRPYVHSKQAPVRLHSKQTPSPN